MRVRGGPFCPAAPEASFPLFRSHRTSSDYIRIWGLMDTDTTLQIPELLFRCSSAAPAPGCCRCFLPPRFACCGLPHRETLSEHRFGSTELMATEEREAHAVRAFSRLQPTAPDPVHVPNGWVHTRRQHATYRPDLPVPRGTSLRHTRQSAAVAAKIVSKRLPFRHDAGWAGVPAFVPHDHFPPGRDPLPPDKYDLRPGRHTSSPRNLALRRPHVKLAPSSRRPECRGATQPDGAAPKRLEHDLAASAPAPVR